MTEPVELDVAILPAAAVGIVRALEARGYETWTVGGGVRDALLGQPHAADWDLATRARPQQVQRVFTRTVPVGVEHGTVGVLKDGKMFEVTTFRRDIETTGRHAVVRFADSIEEDLARRDFTLNALAWHPITGEVRDPFGGAADLRNRVLRAVGDPSERFKEDYLRILRGLRFAGRMNLDIESQTWGSMTAAVEGLSGLSAERVHEELHKVLSATRRASATLSLYSASGALSVVIPGLDGAQEDPVVWTQTLLAIDALPMSDSTLRVAALFAPMARSEGIPTVLATLKALRFSNAASERIAGCVAPPWDLPESADVGVSARRWAASARPASRRDRMRLALAQARARALHQGVEPAQVVRSIRQVRHELRSGHALDVGDLAIDGRDIIRLGQKPGPRIGEILEHLLTEVLETPEANSREHLSTRAQALMEREAP